MATSEILTRRDAAERRMTLTPTPGPGARRLVRMAGKLGGTLSWLIVVLGAVAIILPFLWMLGVAFRTEVGAYQPKRREDPAR